ncbi:cytochrome P450 [Jatrophihabitans sp. DSM 45814]
MTQAPEVDIAIEAVASGCPVADWSSQGPPRAPMSYYAEMDRLRSEADVLKVNEGAGFTFYTRYEQILEIAQHPEYFSNQTIDPRTNKPGGYELVPQSSDGAKHAKWRRVLGSYFSPGRIEKLLPSIRGRAIELIESFADRGHCDFVKEFAQLYPTAIFLDIMGLPADQLSKFMAWEKDILHPAASDMDEAIRISQTAQQEVTDYFVEMLVQRRAIPAEQRGKDLVSEALTWKIDGEPIDENDLLSFYLLMFEAGLDTVTAEISWGFHHLATHPVDRDRIVSDPAVIPAAVEELLRVYPMVTISRFVTEDNEIGGCPLKAGERVMLSLPSAGRDENVYENSTTVNFDRGTIQHLTFGAGPHRCLGSHLARHELATAYAEFHKRIPNYRLADGAEFTETHSGLFGLTSLPLVWDVEGK